MDTLFIIDQATLYSYTRVIARTIPAKAIIPAHEFVRIRSVDESIIELSAANSENYSSVVIENVLFEDSFDVAVEYSFLKPLKARELDLTFSIDGNRCVVTCLNSRWEVPMIDPGDMPRQEFEWDPLLEVPAAKLKDVLESVSPFVLNEYNSNINNVHFKNTEEYLCVGASNHFSCALYTFDQKINRDVSFMISKDTADLVADIADTGMVYIYINEKALKFQTTLGNVTAVGSAWESNRVNNYQRLAENYIKRNHDTIQVIDKSYFKEQIRKAAAFSPADKRMLMVDILDDKLHMQVEDYMGGRKSEQDIDVILDQKGTATKFIVAYDQLLRIVNTSPSLGISMEIPSSDGDGRECIDQPLVVQDEGFIFLLMPLTV